LPTLIPTPATLASTPPAPIATPLPPSYPTLAEKPFALILTTSAANVYPSVAPPGPTPASPPIVPLKNLASSPLLGPSVLNNE